MLGYLDQPRRKGEDVADRLLADLAQRLAADGVRLAGAVQANRPASGSRPAEMVAKLLHPGGGEVVISQALGPGARGCCLDAEGLERAAQQARDGLAAAQLVLLSKFGRQEAAGRGFRDLVAEGLHLGLPVLVAISPDAADAFARFADGLAEAVAPDAAEGWCRAALQNAANG
ncbi:DUF2478 domain-containing protein [Paracoccus suum]|uniref:DUF2478 domain-containing protein n=1 Tax=Paracoccus suum TaxID=2259340 RepID=A0A344PI49_9RHOB|nr:DUF2478 domain-containing protein [Paracoccus suum]AXC49054.1 DUF2478 domain-containing protein [Paracoccus suum]